LYTVTIYCTYSIYNPYWSLLTASANLLSVVTVVVRGGNKPARVEVTSKVSSTSYVVSVESVPRGMAESSLSSTKVLLESSLPSTEILLESGLSELSLEPMATEEVVVGVVEGEAGTGGAAQTEAEAVAVPVASGGGIREDPRHGSRDNGGSLLLAEASLVPEASVVEAGTCASTKSETSASLPIESSLASESRLSAVSGLADEASASLSSKASGLVYIEASVSLLSWEHSNSLTS